MKYDTGKRESKEGKEKRVRRGREGLRKRGKQEGVGILGYFPPVQYQEREGGGEQGTSARERDLAIDLLAYHKRRSLMFSGIY